MKSVKPQGKCGQVEVEMNDATHKVEVSEGLNGDDRVEAKPVGTDSGDLLALDELSNETRRDSSG